jgi:hypothetical protein
MSSPNGQSIYKIEASFATALHDRLYERLSIERHTWVTEAREAVSLLLLLWVKEPHARAPF